MLRLQGDEEIIDNLYLYLKRHFPRLKFEKKIPLKNLFIEPENKWLKSIWSYGHADIAIFRHSKLTCILEPGGWYHAKEEKQKMRDIKKDKICKLYNINVLRFFNDVVNNDLLNPKFKKILKKYIYGKIG